MPTVETQDFASLRWSAAISILSQFQNLGSRRLGTKEKPSAFILVRLLKPIVAPPSPELFLLCLPDSNSL